MESNGYPKLSISSRNGIQLHQLKRIISAQEAAKGLTPRSRILSKFHRNFFLDKEENVRQRKSLVKYLAKTDKITVNLSLSFK